MIFKGIMMKIKTVLNRIMLLIIVCFSAFVFWLGLENKTLQENSIGIVHTKISGWSDKIILPGKFNWSFEKVIPTNYNLNIFIIESKDIGFSIEKTLVSGDLYASFNSIDVNNFLYNYKLSGTIQLKKESLANLVSNSLFTQNSFSKWEDNNILKIKNILETYINNHILNNEVTTLNKEVQKYISELFPYYTFDNIFINLNRPDMDLYNICRDRYLQNIQVQSTADKEYLVESLKQQNEEQLKLDLLKKYGEVFTAYPIMIDYLKIDKEMDLDRATIDNFISPQSQK